MIVKVVIFFIFINSMPSISNAQTCNEDTLISTPDDRFLDHNDGTVTDLITNLTWKKCSEGQIWNSVNNLCESNSLSYNWKNALERIQSINVEGGGSNYTDWRLPNIKELASIIESSCFDPAINLKIFPNTPSKSFWSSSPDNKNYKGSRAWYISFTEGYVKSYDKIDSYRIRLVRTGNQLN